MDKQDNLISIIIPVYNVEKYIGKCIESLFNQTYCNFEVIIVDDGSPDHSISVAQNLVGDDPRFVFYHKENGGQASARNLGLNYARGDYIAFLDSDDYIDPTFLEKLYKRIIKEDVDICLCNINVVKDNKVIGIIQNDPDKYKFDQDYCLCLGTVSSFIWDKLFKKSVFDNMRFDESIRTYEDSHFVFKLIYSKSMTVVNESLYNYVQREGSTTNSIPITYLQDKRSVMQAYLDFYKKNTIRNNEYLKFCYLSAYILTCSVDLVRYSKQYSIDIKDFLHSVDKNFFNLQNILWLIKKYRKKGLGLLCLRISPQLFYYLISLNDKKNGR